MQEIDEIKEEKKEPQHPTMEAVSRFQACLYRQDHTVVNRQVSSYPRISPLEADLMEMGMEGILGG